MSECHAVAMLSRAFAGLCGAAGPRSVCLGLLWQGVSLDDGASHVTADPVRPTAIPRDGHPLGSLLGQPARQRER